MRTLLVAAISISWLTLGRPAAGMTLRYALIIGNNIGMDSDHKAPFPPLAHAEQEAARIKKALTTSANFDTSDKRTRLLTGATTTQVKAAFEALSRQKREDQTLFGPVDTIFLLYFTGHGLEKRLLLEDGPLSSFELTRLFNTFGADFSIGIFDACHVGSFESILTEKGIRATPEFNMLQELPGEVLAAKGSVWYLSSGKGQASYEDSQIGGVFTHFFLESLNNAHRDGPGITLESIWKYVRDHTAEYAASRHRTQIPEQVIYNFRSNASVYFAFPVPRTATLMLTEAIGGRFALVYADSHLTEVFEKKVGRSLRLAVYPGRARLVLLDSVAARRSEHPIRLPEAGTLIIHTLPETPPAPAIGERSTVLFTKGAAVQAPIAGMRIEPGASLLMGARGAFSYTAEEMLSPRYRFALPFRLDLRRIFSDISLVYGADRRQYTSWGYSARMVGGNVGGGFALDFSSIRLNLRMAVAFSHIWQSFEDHTRRSGWQYHPTAGVSVLYPRRGRFFAELFVDVGPLYSPGAGVDAEGSWIAAGGAGLSLFYRLL